jgi:hypothetical protein
MSVFNGGTQSAQVMGGYLYDWLGFTILVLISAAFTALADPVEEAGLRGLTRAVWRARPTGTVRGSARGSASR